MDPFLPAYLCPVLFQAFEVPRDGVFNVLQRFLSCATLRDPAWQGRACRRKYAILVLFNSNAIVHI
mgnify:CR=1 FL=1